jgi:nitroreductase
MLTAIKNKKGQQIMLATDQAIRQRRAVKEFDAAHRFTAAEEATLFDLARQTPSSFNIQHWRIVKVTDMALRQQIRAAAWGQAQITDASLLLVLCADIEAWNKKPERYWEASPEAAKILVPMIGQFYGQNAQAARDEALRSVGLIAQTIMLAAKAMGYDSCPMIGFDPAKVGEIIRLPKDHLIGMIVTVGKAAKPARPKGGYLPLDQIVIENGF